MFYLWIVLLVYYGRFWWSACISQQHKSWFNHEGPKRGVACLCGECWVQADEMGTSALILVYLRCSQEQFQNRCCFLEEILQFDVFQEIRQFLEYHSMDKNVTDIQLMRKKEGTHQSIYLCLVHFTWLFFKWMPTGANTCFNPPWRCLGTWRMRTVLWGWHLFLQLLWGCVLVDKVLWCSFFSTPVSLEIIVRASLLCIKLCIQGSLFGQEVLQRHWSTTNGQGPGCQNCWESYPRFFGSILDFFHHKNLLNIS